MPHKLRLVALLLVAALSVTACRDRGDDDGTTASPSGTPAATAPPSPLPTTEMTSPAPTPPPFEAGTFERMLAFGGEEREYRLFVPDTLDGTAAPLVIGLHGGFGNGAQFADTARFDAQAREGHFIAAYPNGLGIVPTWNGGRCCGYAARNNVDDVGFIEAVIDDITAGYAIDPARVYAAGHSNGGILALRLACESDRFRAVAAVAGSLERSSCDPPAPTSVLIIHGDADESHPLEGGRGDNSVANVDFTSVARTLEVMAPAMGCSEIVDEAIEGPLTTTAWRGCTPGTAVRLIVIEGASHAWPRGKQGLIFRAVPSQDLDATAAIWDFFKEVAP